MKKKILIIGNHDFSIYNFRKELIQALQKENYEVHIMLPYGEKVELLKNMGCIFHNVKMERRGKNPIQEGLLIDTYYKIIKKIKPNLILTYTIKPNIYGGVMASILRIPYIPTITGLGSAIERQGALKKIIFLLYKIALKRSNCVFFQNKRNLRIFLQNKIISGRYQMVNGSGVNLSEFSLLEYPEDDVINFIFIGRIMREKGIEEYLKAAHYISKRHKNTMFYICGFNEEQYQSQIARYEKEGWLKYLGLVTDIKAVLKNMHCTILPSYHEGMSNALLESASCGRPVIASNIPGCQETYIDKVSGFGVTPKSSRALVEKIEEFLEMSYEEKRKMGLEGRKKMRQEFDRIKIVKKYLSQIKKIENR